MNIRLIGRTHSEFFIILGQVRFQKPIGFIFCLDAVEPHLLDQPILKDSKEPLHPSFRLRRQSMNDFHAKLFKDPLKLTEKL